MWDLIVSVPDHCLSFCFEGSQTELPYSRTGRTSPLYADSLTSCGHADKLRTRKPRVLLAFVHILLTCAFHFKSLVIVTPRYLIYILRYQGQFLLNYRKH